MAGLLDKLQKRFFDSLVERYEAKHQKIGSIECWDCLAKVDKLSIVEGELLCRDCAESRVEFLEEKRKARIRARAVQGLDCDEELGDI